MIKQFFRERLARHWSKSTLLSLCVLTSALLFFSIAFFVVYNRASESLQQIAYDEASTALQTAAVEAENTFLHEWKLLTSSENRQTFSQASSFPSSSTVFYSQLLTLKQQMRSIFTTSDLVPNVMLLRVEPELASICSPRYISDNLERDYNQGIFQFGELDYQAWISMVTESDHRYLRRGLHIAPLFYQYHAGYHANSLFLVYPFTTGYSKVQLYGLLQLNVDELQQRLTAYRYLTDDFLLYLNDELLFSTAENQPASADDPRYVHCFIDQLNLSCYVALNHEEIIAGIQGFKLLLGLLLGAFVLAAAILVLGLIMRWYYPVLRISRGIPTTEQTKHLSPISQLETHLSALHAENMAARETIERFRPIILQELLQRFLRGGVLDESEKGTIQNLFQLDDTSSFRLLVIGNLDPANLDIDCLAQAFDSVADKPVQLWLAAALDGCLIAVAQQQEEAENREQFEYLLSEMNMGSNGFAMGISDTYAGYTSVPTAYQEALSGLLDAQAWHNPSVVWSDDVQNRTSTYHFSYQQLEQMFKALRHGEAATLFMLFDQVERENFHQPGNVYPRQSVCMQFYRDIVGLIVRLSSYTDVSPVIESLLANAGKKTLPNQIALLRDALKECISLLPTKSNEHPLATQIQTYLQEHYANVELSLSMLASHFSISESTLSKFIKSRIGTTFSSYLENLRMQQAERLLMTSELSVRAISSEVGYTNLPTFYNAFRRTHGLTPSQWLDKKSAQLAAQ